MARKRKQYSQKFKFKVALEAAKGQATINEIASRYQVHPNQVRNWKSKLIEEGSEIFDRKTDRAAKDQAVQEAELFEQIGRLKMELEWLKKKASGID